MATEYNIKITEQKVEVKDAGDTEYRIRTKDEKEQTVKFEKKEKNQESEKEIELQYSKKGKNDIKGGEGKDFSSKVKWDGGGVVNGMKVTKKELESGVELKDELSLPMGFFKKPTIPCGIGLFVIIAGLIALVGGGVASSGKEDKEEESL